MYIWTQSRKQVVIWWFLCPGHFSGYGMRKGHIVGVNSTFHESDLNESVKHPFLSAPDTGPLPILLLCTPYLEFMSQDLTQIAAAPQSLLKLSWSSGISPSLNIVVFIFLTYSIRCMLPLLIVFFNYVINEWCSGIFFILHPEGQQNAFLIKALGWELKKLWTERQETWCCWLCSELRGGSFSRALNLTLFLSSAY